MSRTGRAKGGGTLSSGAADHFGTAGSGPRGEEGSHFALMGRMKGCAMHRSGVLGAERVSSEWERLLRVEGISRCGGGLERFLRERSRYEHE